MGNAILFEVVKSENIRYGSNKTSTSKSSQSFFSFFRGCPKHLGCSLLIRGCSDVETLKLVKKVTRRALHYAFDWYLSASFLHDACLMEKNAPGALTYPGIMMFTKVDMFGGKQNSHKLSSNVVLYTVFEIDPYPNI